MSWGWTDAGGGGGGDCGPTLGTGHLGLAGRLSGLASCWRQSDAEIAPQTRMKHRQAYYRSPDLGGSRPSPCSTDQHLLRRAASRQRRPRGLGQAQTAVEVSGRGRVWRRSQGRPGSPWRMLEALEAPRGARPEVTWLREEGSDGKAIGSSTTGDGGDGFRRLRRRTEVTSLPEKRAQKERGIVERFSRRFEQGLTRLRGVTAANVRERIGRLKEQSWLNTTPSRSSPTTAAARRR